jgi:glutamyl-tRNA reductase
MHRLILLGLNHTTAPLAVREKLAFNAEQRAAALTALRERFSPCEAVLLSTCNRVELYVAGETHGKPKAEEVLEFFAGLRSLDANLGQVREAYEAARNLGMAGPMLHPLFQRAAAVSKKVMAETSLAEGRLSVASIAVEYARRIFDVFSDKTVLSIGAGKMASLVLAHLAALSPGSLVICNRHTAKAQQLAEKFSGRVAAFETLADQLAAADIVVSSTGALEPIITRKTFETVMKRRRHKPVFLIDIAVPRDVESAVGELENVYLYNMDDLQQVVAATRGQRQGSIEAAGKIVAEQVEEFTQWHRTRQLGPVIDQLYRRSHTIAQEELTRALQKLPNISESEKHHLEDLTRRIVNKLLHDPVQMLRDSENLHQPTERYVHAMEKLFNLEESGGNAKDSTAQNDSAEENEPGEESKDSISDQSGDSRDS